MVLSFLTSAYPLERHFFLIPGWSLKVLGFHPETKRTLPVQLWALFNFCWHTFGIYAQFHFGVNYLATDIPMALDAFCPAFSSVLSWLKISCIWWYRAELRTLIGRVRELNAAQQSPAAVEVKARYFTFATQLSFLVLLGTMLTAASFSTRPIVVNVFRFFNGRPIVVDMPYNMVLPEFSLSMPIYPLTHILIHWYGFITAIGLAGGDGLFLAFCFYITTLLKTLCFDLKTTLRDISVEPKLGPLTEAEVCFKLMKIIERHNEIVELMHKFSDAIVLLTLGHFVTSSIIIGTSVVDLMLFSGYGIVVYVVYTMAVVGEIFIYCLGGTAVMESSVELANAAYSSHWYSYSMKIQKMVLLIMIRSQRALAVKVPFFAPSLPVLTSILRFTGSLIALANQIL